MSRPQSSKTIQSFFPFNKKRQLATTSESLAKSYLNLPKKMDQSTQAQWKAPQDQNRNWARTANPPLPNNHSPHFLRSNTHSMKTSADTAELKTTRKAKTAETLNPEPTWHSQKKSTPTRKCSATAKKRSASNSTAIASGSTKLVMVATVWAAITSTFTAMSETTPFYRWWTGTPTPSAKKSKMTNTWKAAIAKSQTVKKNTANAIKPVSNAAKTANARSARTCLPRKDSRKETEPLSWSRTPQKSRGEWCRYEWFEFIYAAGW